MAKPWATSHLAEVARGLGIDLRISGEVKEALVPILTRELEQVTRRLEEDTLTETPDRRTLSDPSRARLGFSRTRGMMIDNISRVDSVSAAAVVAANEAIESFLQRLLRSASEAAAVERVGTIKQRHLDKALQALGAHESANEDADGGGIVDAVKSEADPLEESLGAAAGGAALTPSLLRDLAKRFGGKRLEAEALDELLLLHYDHAADIQHELQEGVLGGNAQAILDSMERFQTLMMLGWLRRMLVEAAKRCEVEGAPMIGLRHIVEIDPWN